MKVTKELMQLCKKNFELKIPCSNCKHKQRLCYKLQNVTGGLTPFDVALENGFIDIIIEQEKK